MEYENTYNFRNTENGIVIITERNTRITYTINRQHKIGRIVIAYERVRIIRTARARVVYFMHNNRLAQFKRAFVPATKRKLHNYGVNISVIR